MSPPPDHRSGAAGGRIPRIAAVLTLVIGLFVLMSWQFGFPLPNASSVAMKANTAAGCVLAGSVLWLLQDLGPTGGKRRQLLRVLAAALIVLAALNLSRDLHFWTAGADLPGLGEAAAAVGSANGQMASKTALCFLLFGAAACLLAARPGPRRARVLLAVQCAAALLAGIATLTLISHAVGIPVTARSRDVMPMAAYTGIAFLALALGLLAVTLREEGRWAIGKWVTGAFLGSLLLALLVSGMSAKTAVDLEQSDRLLVQAQQMRVHNGRLLAALEQVDAAQHGYLLTGQATFLSLQPASIRAIAREMDELGSLTAGDRGQQARLQSLQYAVAARLNYASSTLRIYRDQGRAAAVTRIQSGRPRAHMARIRDLVQQIDSEEARLARIRQAESAHTVEGMFTLLPLGGLMSLLILSGGLLFLNREANERQRAENDRDRFFTLSVDLLCIADVDGYFKRLSPAFTATLGWSLDELLARPFEDFLHPDDIAATRADIEDLLVPGAQARLFENRMRHRDGSWRVLSWKSVIEPNGRIYSTARDVTEARLGEQRIIGLNAELIDGQAALQAANKDLESFSYSISHDLRAPLRHIDGYARMLSEDAADRLSPEMLRFLQTIIQSARRMGVLIDDLLAFSRLGRQPVALQQVNMQDLAAHAADEVRNDSNRLARIEIGDLPQVAGDPALLRQVWTNLLSNALKYSAPRGDQAHITVSGERKGDRMHFQVRDNGVGFDMRYADKLFGVFQRLHGQDQFEGTGVGLAIVQRIVLRHGGQVSASAEPDRGAIFSFDLPSNEVTA